MTTAVIHLTIALVMEILIPIVSLSRGLCMYQKLSNLLKIESERTPWSVS